MKPTWKDIFADIPLGKVWSAEDIMSYLEENYETPVKKGLSKKMYRIMHKPSGLFLQPLKHRGNNLSKTGKTYASISYAKSAYNPEKAKEGERIVVSENGTMHKILKNLGFNLGPRRYYYNQVFMETQPSDWEIVEV